MDGYENTNGRTSTFKDCTFTGNYVQNALSKGGAVWVQRSEKTVFENCSFEGNYCACATSAKSCSLASEKPVCAVNSGTRSW